MVGLHYPNGTVPHNAKVQLNVTAPTRALGALVQERGLVPPKIDSDAMGAFRSTLQAIEQAQDGLPVAPDTMSIALFDDGAHDDGAMEPDGVFNSPMHEFALVEGTYDFRAVASFGDGCVTTREAFWSIHVEVGIDPDASDVSVVDETEVDGGNRGVIVVVPRDKYGNPLGPGRPEVLDVNPLPGVTVKGGVKDRGDGSYGIGVFWEPTANPPGVIVQQPDRPPIVLVPPQSDCPPEKGDKDCTDTAEDLLECMGLPESEVRKIRIKSVCFEVVMKDEDC